MLTEDSTQVEGKGRKKNAALIQPDRFATSPATLWIDKFMTHFIKVGGIGIIAAVCGIFVFIFTQTLPLFQRASVTPQKTVQLAKNEIATFGVDEWGELPFFVEKSGKISFLNMHTNVIAESMNPAVAFEKEVTTQYYNQDSNELIYGTSDGHFFKLTINYSPVYENEERRIEVDVKTEKPFKIGTDSSPVVSISHANSGERQMVAAIQEDANGNRSVHAVTLIRKKTLFGVGKVTPRGVYDLTSELADRPEKLLVNSYGDAVLVSTESGRVYFFFEEGDKLELRQVFSPFEDTASPKIASIDFLLGSVSVVVTNHEGINRIFSLFVPEGRTERLFDQTKAYESLPGGASFYNASLRNKAFLIGKDQFASLRYATTEAIRWQEYLPFTVKSARIGRKYDSIYFLDTKNKLHVYELDDPHPESGLNAFFGKLWYEGYTHPSYEWQSTGGTDDFEPKLSLIPLIIGTLKGTFYAMLFALPIALIAGIYTSQFAHPKFKNVVKPTMEIMASLPSVVLGFLAALWLAPIMETRLPSFILMILLIPVSAMAIGWAWTELPMQYRKFIPAGYEWIPLLPVLFIVSYLGWIGGPHLEKLLFTVTDPQTGLKIADFRLWWPQVTGTPFEQRNSLVVGFMMGFAVIPIIFTITEDALSNVPKALVSGSLALGASRWQTAVQVVLPTAFPGIFSAIMIGLGRAVGETMIVVMATGNTPIMDFNIFSGMRTLSANIAVELPEAPYLGTLYRTLFLGAVVLFILTFFVNTFAEIIRQRFREKYKVV